MPAPWAKVRAMKLAQNERAEITTPNGDIHIRVYPDGQLAVRFIPTKGWIARLVHQNSNTGEMIVGSRRADEYDTIVEADSAGSAGSKAGSKKAEG